MNKKEQPKAAVYARVGNATKIAVYIYGDGNGCQMQQEYYLGKYNHDGTVKIVGFYADVKAAKSKRPALKKLIADCKKGGIDEVHTKSVSRLSRNIIDALTVINELKALGVAIVFEVENLNTLTSMGDTVMEATARKITVIPVNPRFDYKATNEHRKKRRAAYARVSTDSDEQMTSYRAQCKYYTEKLANMDDTEFVGLYADEGLSGTSIKKRKEFQRLMADCRAGLIDEIWVKSISRFSRNIVDCVQHIRELKEIGINIHFESINVDTLDSKGELLIIILASIAEEESRNISENIRWAREKAFEQGKVMVSNLYGYAKDENKQLVINPDQAPIVRRVFTEYLSGYTTKQIAIRLNDEGIPTYYNTKWTAEGIRRMLINEKYKGDAVLQKTYSPNFLSKKRVKNEGQARMFFVEGSHPPIISRDLHDKIQAEIKRRADLSADGERSGGKYSSRHIFSGKIKCGQCGQMLRRHGHYYKEERIPLWLCKEKQLSKGKGCTLPHIKEAEIEQAFVRMLNRLIGDREEFIADFMETASQIITDADQAAYDITVAKLNQAREEMLELNRANAKQLISSAEYYDASLKLMDKIDALTAETQAITDLINAKKTAKHRVEEIRQVLEGNILDSFDQAVFKRLINTMTIKSERELEFTFSCGITVTEIL